MRDSGLPLEFMGAAITAAFVPSSLFSGEAGAWYDPSDLSSMFQDAAGTTPVTADGDPVGRINDKSGNNNHATQATAAARPLYRTGGYLEFDGVDDRLATGAFAITQPIDRVSAIRQISWTDSDIIFGDNAVNFGGLLQQFTATPSIRIYSGNEVATTGLAVGTNGVVTERHNGATSRIAINNGAYATGNAGAAVPALVSIGGYSGGSGLSNIRFYGMLMIARALTDAEITNLRNHFAGKSGVTL